MITLIQIIIFALYISLIIYRYGVLKSISDSWYKLEEDKLGFLFTLFIWSIAFLMCFQTNGTTGFFFASGAAFAFVGAATQFKEKYVAKIHVAGATLGYIFGNIALVVERGGWAWISPIGMILAYILARVFKIPNKTWWVEIMGAILLFIGLLL